MKQFSYRLSTILIITTLSMIAISCSQNTSKPANYSGNNNSTEKASSAMMMTKNNVKPTEDEGGKLAKPNQLLPEISERYSGVKIMLVNRKNESNKLSQVVPFNKRTSIEGSDIEVAVLSFFTQFTLADNGMVKNISMKENNPAAKVSIFKAGNQVFDGWLFQHYPEMHNYDDDTWQILLVGGVAK